MAPASAQRPQHRSRVYSFTDGRHKLRLVAQWLPRNGDYTGPLPTWAAVALLGAGGVVVV
ncbi:hypothetical protein [Streptomyces sp. NPDC054834]